MKNAKKDVHKATANEAMFVKQATRKRFEAVDAYLERVYKQLDLPNEEGRFTAITTAHDCIDALANEVQKAGLRGVIAKHEIREFIGMKWHIRF
jgi:hypothetical protein